MSAGNLEVLLARLYTDARFRQAFLADREGIARAHGLDETEAAALRDIDRNGLSLASGSFARKRAAHSHRRRSWIARVVDRIRGNR